MAITQYTEPQTVEPVTITDWQNSIEKLNEQDKGMNEITLNTYVDTSSELSVTVGSIFENNGAYYNVNSSAEVPSGWTSISNDTQTYIKYDVSSNVFQYTVTAPSWNDAKQGWYNGNDRYFFNVYKDSSGNYTLIGNIIQRSIKKAYELNPVNLDVDQTATIKDIYQEDARNDHKNVFGTESVVFDVISPTIPEVGQQCALMGSYMDANPSGKFIYILSKAERTSSTVITLFYCLATFTVAGALNAFSVGTRTVTDGSSTYLADEWSITTGNRIP